MELTQTQLFQILTQFIFFLSVLFFFFFYIALRYRRKKIENDHMKELFARQLANSRIEMQRQTLKYVSQELHDNIGQIASLLKIYLSTIHYDDLEKTKSKVEESKALVQNMITDIKLLSTTLNTEKLVKMDLADAVKTEALKINRAGIFNVAVDVEGIGQQLDSDRKLILFRMVQEILNNTVNHSQARHISIKFKYIEKNLTLTIADDGIGFDVNEVTTNFSRAGNGIINLKDRAKAIRSEMKINSLPGKGTVITIEIPQ